MQLVRPERGGGWSCGINIYLSHQLPVHGTEGDDPAGPTGETHQEVPGGGGEGDADGAALQTVGGVTVA